MTSLSGRTKVFICHCSSSKKDTDHFERLKKQLKPLERDGKIVVWDKTSLQSGGRPLESIKQEINLTRVAVILLSPDLLDSDYIYQNELIPLFDAAEHKEVNLLPVLLSACNWERTYLKDLLLVNRDKIPVGTLPDGKREILWKKVVDDIWNIMETIPIPTVPTSTKAKIVSLPAHEQNILNQIADQTLDSPKRVACAHSLIELSETFTLSEQGMIQDRLHSIRLDESDMQVFNAINLVLAFLHDATADESFLSLFLDDAIPSAFRERATTLIAKKINGTRLIILLTGEEGTHHALKAGLDIVHSLQHTKREDLKRLLRVALDQHPFTAPVRAAILDALEPTRDGR